MIKTIIIDRGHATLDNNCKYATAGKQAKLSDGRYVYEGFENQKYAEILAICAKRKGYRVEYTVKPDDPRDISLTQRVRYANALPDRHNSIFLSLHNNAGGNETANGTELFTSIGQTMSDKYCESIANTMIKYFPKRKMRTDLKDGDKDKEENFYVLKNTVMPAILFEFGFFDNPTDYDWLSNKDNIQKMCEAIIDGIIEFDIKAYGKEAWETRNY